MHLTAVDILLVLVLVLAVVVVHVARLLDTAWQLVWYWRRRNDLRRGQVAEGVGEGGAARRHALARLLVLERRVEVFCLALGKHLDVTGHLLPRP